MRGRLGVVLVPAAASAFAQQDFLKVEVTSQKLAEGIYMLQGTGGNMGLSIGEDAAFLVDDQYAPLTPRILAAVKALTARGDADRGGRHPLRPPRAGEDPDRLGTRSREVAAPHSEE